MTQMGATVTTISERETEWVYREGFGWVERPVEVPVVEVETEDDDDRESAAA